jgi:hypothetical protein
MRPRTPRIGWKPLFHAVSGASLHFHWFIEWTSGRPFDNASDGAGDLARRGFGALRGRLDSVIRPVKIN